MVGLNNIKANDYVNAVVQILCRVVPFRNYFLDESNYSHVTQDPLVITCECPLPILVCWVGGTFSFRVQRRPT